MADDQSSQPVTPPPRSSNWRTVVSIIGSAIILLGVGAGGYYLAQHRAPNPTPAGNGGPIGDLAPAPENPNPPEPSGVDVASTYKISGIVQWQDPVQIDPIIVFDSKITDHSYDKAYKVGTFVSGQYKGGDLLLGEFQCDCLGNASFHAVKVNNNYTLLGRYTSYVPDAESSTTDITKFKIDGNYILPDLEFPETISGPKPRQQLQIQHPLFGNYTFFKLDANIKPAFVDPVVGQVYVTADHYDKSLVDSFGGHGFYFKAPDSTVVYYSLVVDFVGTDNVPQLTWSDGSANRQEYTYRDIGGCGAQNYASVVPADEVSLNDLIVAGTNSQGDKIYTLKDSNHPLLKDLYDNRYYVEPGKTKLAYSEFIKTRPMFFWYDTFGRLIQFQNSQFLPQAECAKPVIYLYPEQRQAVNVQLSPQGGWLKSEPAYKGGWKVMAEPSGLLTNLADQQQYPYLFWEGRGGLYQTPDRGFVVAQAEVPSFLDSKLHQLGLNDQETADFKEFWLPRMQDAPYYFITFMGNSVMDQLAPLSISPQPDTVIRVLMDFRPLREPIAAQGYTIRTPQRRGFTVVEWGGVIH